jgi:hypothetical protein
MISVARARPRRGSNVPLPSTRIPEVRGIGERTLTASQPTPPRDTRWAIHIPAAASR